MTKPNKYAFLPVARQNLPAEVEADPVEPPGDPESPATFALAPDPIPKPTPPALPRAVEKPKGKRERDGYSQRTAYLPDDLHERTTDALTADNRAAKRQGQPSKDFSELVAELLAAWLDNRPAK